MSEIKDINEIIPVSVKQEEIVNMIYTIRGKQVMLDSDLAVLYGYDVRALNQQVKRNANRFPDDFMFQLSKDEIENLKSQIVTSSWGGRRKPPYAFTEQGIYMLATVLKGEVAEQQSIFIMRAFREMRRFISNNALLFEKVSNIELKQLEYQKNTDERFDKVFQYIEDHAESEQKVFFDGQIYDAFSFIVSLIQKAQTEIILIDGYVDVKTLDLISKKKQGVDVKIITYANARLSNNDISNFNMQYPNLEVRKSQVFHDRFIILDSSVVYHIGASIKDAGNKCFGITKIDDGDIIQGLIKRIQSIA